MLRSLRALARFVHALIHVGRGWWIIRFHFPQFSAHERERSVERWSERMLNLLGITLRVEGTPPTEGPVLLVCNHISWLDILAIHAACHVRFVSRAQVRHWPFLGTLATGAGTLYIERERRRDALRVVHLMTEALQAGDKVAVFPEGTTSDGQGMLPFHANLLQPAISAGAPVLPAALRFIDAATGQTCIAARYVGDESLLHSFWRTLCAAPFIANVRFGEPELPEGRDRRAWALALQGRVQALRDGTLRDS